MYIHDCMNDIVYTLPEVINPRRACAGGLRYLVCVCVCVCVSVCLSVTILAKASLAKKEIVQHWYLSSWIFEKNLHSKVMA